MFTVEIAGVPIGINNRYGEVELLCKDYMTDREPMVTVSATMEDIIAMSRAEVSSGKKAGASGPEVIKEYPLSYAEQLCIYREIALAIIDYDAFLMHAIDMDSESLAQAALRVGVAWKPEKYRLVALDSPYPRIQKWAENVGK